MTPSVNTPTPQRRAADPRPRVALAHDWLVGLRGGEWVLDRIARVVAERADIVGLWTMFDDGRPLTAAIDAIPRRVSWLGRVPGASTRWRRWLLPLYPSAVSSLSRDLAREHARKPIDLLVSTSSAAIKGLRPPVGVPHVCYIHSPARYIWSQASAYGSGNLLRRAGLALARAPFRMWDKGTAANVTEFIANSSHVLAQVARCYGRASTVIYPPVRTDYFTPDPTGRTPSDDAPWLVVSALEPYKRVDLAIDAANIAGHPLVVVGDGSQRARLTQRAGHTVRFVGRVGDEELREYYRAASALLFPQVEDFGIVAGEAQACGLPVVARHAGGALDIVRAGATGMFFNEPTADALLRAIERSPRSSGSCRTNALRFSEARFDDEFRRVLDRHLLSAG